MPETHLSNDDFFVRLSELFEARRKKEHGSVFLTQKRMTYGDSSAFPEPTGDSPFPDLAPTKPLSLIIRATDGKSKDKRPDRLKLSTIVDEEALEGFFLKYSEVCKAGMSGLKKRDRSKNKQKLKAKKKKGGAGTEEVKKV